MYSYLLRVVLNDGSIKEITNITADALKSVIQLVEESDIDKDLVEGVLYFKRERFYLA